MASYNMLASVVVNDKLTTWHFRVKMIRIHSFKIQEFGPNQPPSTIWSYILADEAGSKIEMLMYPADAPRFKGLENHDGKWVEIFRVQVMRAFTLFKPTNTGYKLVVFGGKSIKPIEPLKNHHYIEFKCINDIKYITNTDSLIDIMGVFFNDEPLRVCSDDHRRTKLLFYIRDNIEFQIKCVATRDHAYAFQEEFAKMRGPGVVIAVLKMWWICRYLTCYEEPWIETYKSFSDFRFNPRMEEVDSFRQRLANNDPYVARHGPIVFNFI